MKNKTMQIVTPGPLFDPKTLMGKTRRQVGAECKRRLEAINWQMEQMLDGLVWSAVAQLMEDLSEYARHNQISPYISNGKLKLTGYQQSPQVQWSFAQIVEHWSSVYDISRVKPERRREELGEMVQGFRTLADMLEKVIPQKENLGKYNLFDPTCQP
jgi:hypothetical protein